MSIRDIKNAARLSLHRQMSVQGLYLAPGATVPVECSVRVLDVQTASGDAESMGWARRWVDHPEIVFLVSEVTPTRNGRLTLVDDGAQYRIDNVKPVYGITVSAEALRL